jgi:ectoine hydroxylase-related dioxygenase (phytanoyl-CoA dioxygenase family)
MEALATRSDAFTHTFKSLDAGEIVATIKEKGYFVFEAALDGAFIDQLLKKIDFDRVLVNTNDTGVVTAHNIKYLTHCLSHSAEVYNLITSPMVLDICDKYFYDKYRLTNHRVYQTKGQQHMPWHTDNNTQKGAQFSGKHSMRGLLFLFYLSDVTKNAFQFIENSQKYSDNFDNERYLNNSLVERTHGADIISFRTKKGSLILCDTHGIHRAEPFNDKRYSRTTLLFQVDEVGEDNEGHGEKNLINTEYLKDLTPQVMDYLGFGFNRSYPAFPNTSIATLPLADILGVQKQLIAKAFSAITKNLVKGILPGEALVKAKRIKWLLKSKKSISHKV